jgi:hypothetical protein
MLKLGKAARWMLVTAMPVVAMAQSPQVRPPQPRPAATPAVAPGTAATPAPAAHPAHASPDSRRFVTNENFFHARPKPQPTNSDAQPTAAQPANTRPATVKSTLPVAPKVPATSQPAAAIAVPATAAPQPSAALPAIITPPAANSAAHDPAAVEFSHGELTVVAQRAPLGLVLKLIAARTGAVIDLAPELQNEPVVAQLGPAPAREVLTALLDSPRVDYIVMAPGNDPNGVQRVVVRTRQAFGRVAMATVQSSQPRPAEAAAVTRLDENGHLPNGLVPESPNMTPEQRMENWRKTREAMRVAEIKQQAEDREREKTEPQPQPQPEPQPDNPPQS